MKRLLILAVMAFVLVGTAGLVFADDTEQAEIMGYGTNEFAVKGAVGKQLEEKVFQVINPRLSEISHITVIGYADKTGTRGFNDKIAKFRAEEVKATILSRFPDVKVIAMTRGEEGDVRKVLVEWFFVSSSKQSNFPPYTFFLLYTFLVLSFIALLLAFGRCFFVNKKKEKSTENNTRAIKWVQGKMNDFFYAVPVVFKADGNWHTPFATQRDPGRPIFRSSIRDATKAVKSCMKNPYYAEEIKRLISTGVIKEFKKPDIKEEKKI